MSGFDLTHSTLAETASLPLSPEEQARVEELIPRVRGELSGVLTRIRSGRQSVLSLSKKIGIDRNVCQRVVSGLKPGVSDWEMLELLPGPEGLRLFAIAAAKEISGKEIRSILLGVVEQYATLVQELGGSQTKFLQRVRATHEVRRNSAVVRGELDNVKTRVKLREVATELLGYDVAYIPTLTVVRPIPDSPELVELLQASGLIGLRPMSGPVPVVSYGWAMRAQSQDLAGEQKARPLTDDPNGMGLLDEFCSKPLPVCITEGGDGHARLMLDPGPRMLGRTFDFVTATHWSPGVNPMHEERERWWYQVFTARRPCKRVVFDVYLHRSMAAACMPSAAAFHWKPSMTGVLARHWEDRLPGRVVIEMLGRGTLAAASDGWPLHKRFTDRVFELAGWNADEFVGYRIDVQEPLWSASYFMSFDFSEGNSE